MTQPLGLQGYKPAALVFVQAIEHGQQLAVPLALRMIGSPLTEGIDNSAARSRPRSAPGEEVMTDPIAYVRPGHGDSGFPTNREFILS